MGKKSSALVLALCLSPAIALAANGKKVFEEAGCPACHKVKEASVGPSLVSIAKDYAHKKKELEKFFAGVGKPRVEPGKIAVMKPNLPKIQALSKEEKNALADYILSQK